MERVQEQKIIEVAMADMKISQNPAKLITRGLGSCVGITIYDPVTKTGGMVHTMLPDIDKARIKSNPIRFVNYGIRKMVEDLENQGCARGRLVAKLFGGAHMFSFITSESVLNVGEKNTETARQVLSELGIKISADETGGTFGRTIELNLENGKVLVRTVAFGDKEV